MPASGVVSKQCQGSLRLDQARSGPIRPDIAVSFSEADIQLRDVGLPLGYDTAVLIGGLT